MNAKAYYNEIDPYPAQWLRNLMAADQIAPGYVDNRSIKDVKPDDLKGYTQCHFFAGIGVWSYALRLAGWPDTQSCWTGSCPCQSFSSAGKRKGTADERHLWPDWFKLIRECRPGTIFGEQVSSKDALTWLDIVQSDLEGEGYTFAALDLCAPSVGAPHIRQRLYFVAYTERQQCESWVCRRSKIVQSDGEGTAGELARDREASNLGNNNTRLEGRWSSGERAACSCQSYGRLADSSELRWRGRRDGDQTGSGGALQTEGRSTISNLGNNNTRLEGWGSSGERANQLSAGSPSLVNGYWGDAEWLYCKDEKYRPAKPGIFPLAYGTSPDMGSVRSGEVSPFRVIQDEKGNSIGQAPWRVGMLKGYGNAIVAELAAEFIRSYMDIMGMP